MIYFGDLDLISASNQLLAFHCHEQPKGSTVSIPQAAAVVAMHEALEIPVCVTVAFGEVLNMNPFN